MSGSNSNLFTNNLNRGPLYTSAGVNDVVIRDRVITESFIPINAPPNIDAGLLSRIPLQERNTHNGE